MVTTRRSSSNANGPSPLGSLLGVLGLVATNTTTPHAAPRAEHHAPSHAEEDHPQRQSSQRPRTRSLTRRPLTRSRSFIVDDDDSEEDAVVQNMLQPPQEMLYFEEQDVDSYPNSDRTSSFDPVPPNRRHAHRQDGRDGDEQVAQLRNHHTSLAVPTPPSDRAAPGTPATALPNLALLCLAIAAITLVLSLVIHLGIVAGGLVGPAWSTFKAIERRPGAASINRWAAFWIMSALVFALDRLFLAALLRPWLPGPAYGLMLFLSLVWLSRDDAANTERLYGAFARPLFLRYEDTVDAVFDSLADRLDDITRFGLIQVSNVVKPIALQLDHAAAMARQQHDRIGEKRRLLKTIST